MSGCGCRGCGGMGTLSTADIQSGAYGTTLNQVATDTIGFDPSPIVGSALDDEGIAAGVVGTFTNSGVDYTGDQGKQQVKDIALALDLIPGGQAIGAALVAITNAVGFAHAGPGVCQTDPPPGYGWGDLKAWPHYVPWAASGANLAPPGQAWTESTDPPGSFEQYANLALAYNEALGDNCFSNVAVPPQGLPALLATLIASWNKVHMGPTRTVKRVMPCGAIGCTQKGYDPIANALNWTDPSGALAGKTLQFQVNAGPHVVKLVTLRLVHGATPAKVTAAAPAAVPSSSASTAAFVAVGGAAAAAALLVHLRGPSALPRFLRKALGL